MYPDATCFPFLPGLPSNFHAFSPQKKKKSTKSNLCCPYTHWCLIKLTPSG